MKNLLAIAALSLILFSCNKKSAEDSDLELPDQDSIKKAQKEVVASECFEFVQKKDTISLSVDQDGANVVGNLYFKNYEKDSSHGPVKGEYVGDTLKLDYTFQSEGSTSIREIRFLRSANSLLMGIGDMEDKDGKMSFTKPLSVRYEKSIVLVKTECEL